MKIKFLVFLIIAANCKAFDNDLEGPFLLWGLKNVNILKLPALQAIDDSSLHKIYQSASVIKIFIRNKSTKFDKENFPKFSQIIDQNEWIYLPQEYLTSYPNENVEKINLNGTMAEQDVKIVEIFSDAQKKHGDKNVLGILATQEQKIRFIKRETKNESDYQIYAVPGKILFFTYHSPELKFLNTDGEIKTHVLNKFSNVTANEQQLSVNYELLDQNITVKYNFIKSAGNWKLNEINYDDYTDKSKTLKIYKNAPSAPLGNFSFGCIEKLIFKDGNISFILEGVQIQPFLNSNDLIFGTSHDCVGFTSPGILAGLFVTGILLSILTVGITAVMNIHVPDRFECRSSKQLVFNTQ